MNGYVDLAVASMGRWGRAPEHKLEMLHVECLDTKSVLLRRRPRHQAHVLEVFQGCQVVDGYLATLCQNNKQPCAQLGAVEGVVLIQWLNNLIDMCPCCC